MSIKDIEKFTIDANDIHQLGHKSVVIWGHIGNTMLPVMYIRKPKHIDKLEWNKMMKHIEIKISL